MKRFNLIVLLCSVMIIVSLIPNSVFYPSKKELNPKNSYEYERDQNLRNIKTSNGIIYYCNSETDVMNALVSIGTGSGTIVINQNITLSATINISGGGSYMIQGRTNDTIVDYKGDRTAFKITSAKTCILKNFKINATAFLSLETAVIIIDENANNPIFVENVTIIGVGNESVVENGTGIKIRSDNNIISKNYIYGFCIGIWITDSSSNNINENVVDINYYGIWLELSSNNIVVGNDLYNVWWVGCVGIWLESSSNNIITENFMNSMEISGSSYSSSNNIITKNIISDSLAYGMYITGKCQNNIISENFVNNCIYKDEWGGGIYLDGFNTLSNINNVISKNICKNYVNGIYLQQYCYNNVIDGNICQNNFKGIRTKGSLCYGNIVINNFCHNNSQAGIEIDTGVALTNTVITRNNISHNGVGIHLMSASRNCFASKNYFVQNALHAIDNGVGNKWNNSYIGNYWDNYTGLDANFDGIGDSIYGYIAGSANADDFKPISGNPFHYGQRIYIDGSEQLGINSWQYVSTRAWCNGVGSVFDPYVIEGLTINGGGMMGDSCIRIENSFTKYFSIRNCKLTNSRGDLNYFAGITLDHIKHATVENNDIYDNMGSGIYAINCNHSSIVYNHIVGNHLSGIYTLGSIYSQNKFLNVSDNTISNNKNHGIFLTGVWEGPAFTWGNQISGNGEVGLKIDLGTQVSTYKNKIEDNGQEGIYLTKNSSLCFIVGNYVSKNADNSTSKQIVNIGRDNVFQHNAINGIAETLIIDDSGDGDFTWNDAVICLAYASGMGTPKNPYSLSGIEFYSSFAYEPALQIKNSNHYFNLLACKFSNALLSSGLVLFSTENGKIDGCFSDNNSYGIALVQSNYTLVQNCHFVGNFQGIVEIDCHNNTFLNNYVLNRDQLSSEQLLLNSTSNPSNDDDDSGTSAPQPIRLDVALAMTVGSVGAIAVTFIALKKYITRKKAKLLTKRRTFE